MYTLKFNPLLLLLFFSLKVPVVMRFTAKKRGWMKCEIFTPVYKSGRTYRRTILSEPTFLGCIDKQIFLPTVLRYPCFARENSTINTSTCEGKLVCDWLEEITKNMSIHIFVLVNWSTKDWKFRNVLLPFWQQVLILTFVCTIAILMAMSTSGLRTCWKITNKTNTKRYLVASVALSAL